MYRHVSRANHQQSSSNPALDWSIDTPSKPCFVQPPKESSPSKRRFAVCRDFSNDGGGSNGDEYEIAYSPSSLPGELKAKLQAHLAQGLAAWVEEFTKK